MCSRSAAVATRILVTLKRNDPQMSRSVRWVYGPVRDSAGVTTSARRPPSVIRRKYNVRPAGRGSHAKSTCSTRYEARSSARFEQVLMVVDTELICTLTWGNMSLALNFRRMTPVPLNATEPPLSPKFGKSRRSAVEVHLDCSIPPSTGRLGCRAEGAGSLLAGETFEQRDQTDGGVEDS